MEFSKSSRRVLGCSRSVASSLRRRVQPLSHTSICSRLMKLSLPMLSRRHTTLILAYDRFLTRLRHPLISLKVTMLSLCSSQKLFDSPFFLMSLIRRLIWLLLSRGKCSCLAFSSSMMHSASLASSSPQRQTVSSVTPSSIGMPAQRLRPTVEMYLRGSMEEGQMKLRNPAKSIFSLQPQSDSITRISSSPAATPHSSPSCARCFRVATPSPRQMQLKRARGWKSLRVVMASRWACRMFSCFSTRAKQLQMPAKASASLNSLFLPAGFITTMIIAQHPTYNTMEKHFRAEWPRKRLVLNADDYGCCPSISRGILELAKSGKISSLTAMVNMPHSKQAAQQYLGIRNCLSASVGLHFNLTEGQSLSQPIRQSKMVKNGLFVGKEQFYQIIQQDPECLTQSMIGCQIHAQLREFIRMYQCRPSHIDGHNHVHVVPSIASQVAKYMTELGVYRVRMPSQVLSKGANLLMRQFVSNANTSQHIYAEKGACWPVFTGMQDSGHLSAHYVKQQLEKSDQICLQLMCHPGYPSADGPEWNKHPDRLAQKQQLQSKQFEQLLSIVSKLSNYRQIESNRSQKPFRLLIYSKLEHGSGNYTSTMRYKAIFEQLGFEVFTRSVEPQIPVKFEAEDLQAFLISFRISLILGVNITRTGQVLVQSTRRIRVPYILMLAGTDVNITLKDKNMLMKHRQCIEGAHSVVSMSQSMLQKMQSMCEQSRIALNARLIPQSSAAVPSTNSVHPIKLPARKYILLPTSFRRVKAVHYLLSQLNQLIETGEWQVIIAGPIIEKERKYYQQCLPLLNKIEYVGVLAHEEYSIYLRNAFCLVNCSESEGMSCSILEAFQARVPVVARNNQGNSQLINHKINGLLFADPLGFQKCMQQLETDNELRESIIDQASDVFASRYSPQRQISSFRELIIQEFHRRMMVVFGKQSLLRVFNQDFSHHTSPVNNQLFQQIPSIDCVLTPQRASVMDIGCGTGVFSLFYLNKPSSKQVDLYLVDIEPKLVANALYNVVQSETLTSIRSVTCICSDKFSNVPPHTPVDVLLCNPPQCPFQHAHSRKDKNGGTDGFMFFPPLLEWVSARPHTTLYLLHSYMVSRLKLQHHIESLRLQVSWQSEPRQHRILQQAYEQMQTNLSVFLLQHAYAGNADIAFEDGVFVVPAAVYRVAHPS